jgi:hypothetical protein
MAQRYITDAGALVIPGAYSKWEVDSQDQGIPAAGVVMLIGEAEAGPHFSEEANLQANSYGPDQLAEVIAKYRSGPLVDAYNGVVNANADPGIPGAPDRILLVKTNSSTRASSELPASYGTLFSRNYGEFQNLIGYSIEDEVAEQPASVTFTWVDQDPGVDVSLRVNGSPKQEESITDAGSFVDAFTGVSAVVVGNSVTLTATGVCDGGKSLELIDWTESWTAQGIENLTVTSQSERQVFVKTSREADGIAEELVAGGQIMLLVGHTEKDDAYLSIVKVNGVPRLQTFEDGSKVLDLKLSDYPTINDLAKFIGSKAGYKAKAWSMALGQRSPMMLDYVDEIGIACESTNTTFYPGRIKSDAHAFASRVNSESVLMQFGSPVGRADKGLPQNSALTYLEGGTLGPTTSADIAGAFAALEKVRGNFVVPLFSRNSSLDIEEGLTDSASSYEIAAINALLRTHCLAMSTMKRRRNRQGFASVSGALADQMESAANTAAFRVSMAFQDVQTLNARGSLTWYQPWMLACMAAGMQAAGGYRAIVHKQININAISHASFDPESDTLMENALMAGLLPVKQREDGAFMWVSDQTTYSRDDNFVFNSIQAVYVADLISLTTMSRLERAFVGKSPADVPAPIVRSTLTDFILDDFRRLKWIAPSDDAPLGYKNVKIQINSTAIIVGFEVKLAGAIYFIPINIMVSAVQQTA